MSVPEPVLVVGCGLIGTSLALALREHDIDVMLSDVRPENVELAASRGAGRPGPADDPAVVIVAVPPSAVEAVVVDALAKWPAAFVTDVASVKADQGSTVTALPGGERYVGSHPMAGSERSGPMAASAQLFEGRAWAVTSSPGSQRVAVDAVRDLASASGAVPVEMEPRDHDEAVALVSHLPHLLSVITAAQLHEAPEGHLALAGPGLRDVTRLAASDTELWEQILAGNAGPVRARLQSVRDDLDVLITALGTDPSAVGSVLSRGNAGTGMIPGKHGGVGPVTVTVYVQVPDRPGALSALMADAQASGVNIEDLRIEHGLDRPIGLAEVMVAEDSAEFFAGKLTAIGWSVYR